MVFVGCHGILTFSTRLIFLAVLPVVILAVDLQIRNFLQEGDVATGNSLSARNFGVIGDGITDDSLAMEKFLGKSWLDQKTAFFPAGEYVIGQSIYINGTVNIQGSVQGMTVFKTPRTKILQIYIGNRKHGLRGLTISHIFFDGVTIYFISKRYKYNFRLANCVFFSSRVPLLPISKKANIEWHRVRNGVISNVIILRSKAIHGVGLSFYKTKHVRLENSIVGLDFNNLGWLASQYRGIDTWNNLIQKLYFIKAQYRIQSDQGHFVCSLYGNRDDNLTIEGNVFNGSPYKKGFIDHVIYLKGFDGLYVLGNYARGWPSSPWGGVKMRNGENLVVARNYLVDTGVLLYTHSEISSDYLHQGLENVLVYGNHLVELTNVGRWGTGISYYEPHFTGTDTNINICHNIFEIPNLNVKSPPIAIHISNGDKDEHHVFRDNVYFGTALPVVLVPAGDAEYENDTCAASMVMPYQSILIPDLIIPPYCNQTAFGSACNIRALPGFDDLYE